jgi:hypothetical protein
MASALYGCAGTCNKYYYYYNHEMDMFTAYDMTKPDIENIKWLELGGGQAYDRSSD